MQDLNVGLLKEGFERFSAPRQDGDIDLVTLVRNQLVASGMFNGQSINGFDNDPIIMEAVDKQSHIQRFLLNRYWTRQLMMLNIDTIEIRLHLIANGSEEDWMRLFTNTVLPFVFQHQLPIYIP